MKTILSGLSLLLSALLLASCLSPYLPVHYAPFLSFISLTTPLLVIANLLSLLGGAVLRLRATWLTLVSLIVSYLAFGAFYKPGDPTTSHTEASLQVMSYNVRGFDRYGFLKGIDVEQEILQFIKEEDPDIVCFQEFNYRQIRKFPQYPYHFFNYMHDDKPYVQQAIFSKHPIVGKGSLEFPDSWNNTIYADIRVDGDTLRIYNMHLQSFQVIPSRRMLRHMARGGFYTRITRAFIKQQEQAVLVREHLEASPFPAILCGDFNNTQFSRVYRIVKGDMSDSFEEAGHGFGTTYKLKFLPLRIDAIMADPSLEVLSHKNYKQRYSDHYPVMAGFSLRKTDNSSP